uniref:Carboxylic ester hydrolase n=1 Tax=Vitrella brassicaformis TaxID=1169539 RepID=A0A7S1KGJ3_9ALVE
MPVSERVRVATLPLLLLVASLQVAIGQLIADPEPQAVVSTKYGDVLGHRSNASDRVRVYEGIPYASHARWQLPEPPQPWDGVLNGSESKTRCIQVKADFPDMMAHVPQSEECLELAVWTPAAGQQREELPTVVYIHGGGFAIGSAYDQDKSLFANATDTVVVAMNYRLGVFGFMAHPDLADQQTNFGLHDQLMALKWVKDNIAAFGGDPDDVTLVGYSAGADSVLYHLTWNESWPFFRRAAAFSPSTGFRPITLAEGLVIRGKGFEEAMGVESLEGLMNASATSLNEASPSSMDTGVCQCDPSLPEWRTALRQGGSAAGGGGGGGGLTGSAPSYPS